MLTSRSGEVGVVLGRQVIGSAMIRNVNYNHVEFMYESVV